MSLSRSALRSQKNFLLVVLLMQLVVTGIVTYAPRFQGVSYTPPDYFQKFVPIGIDFACLYVAAKRVVRGQNPYQHYPDDLGKLEVGLLKSSEEMRNLKGDLSVRPLTTPSRYLYGPLGALLFVPLTPLDYLTAYRVFALLSCAAVVASIAVFILALRLDLTASLILAALGGFVCLFSYPMEFAVERGNWDSLIQLGVALACLWWCSNREVRSGTALGIFAGLKVYPATLLLAFFSTPVRCWKPLLAALCGMMVAVLPLGFSAAAEWIENLQLRAITPGIGNPNHSFKVFTLLFSKPHYMTGFWIFTAFSLAWIIILQRLVSHQRQDPTLRAAAFVAPLPLATLVPSISNDYNLTLQILPFLASVALAARLACTPGRYWPAASWGLAGALIVAGALIFAPPISIEGRWAYLLWQKTAVLMAFQTLYLILLSLCTLQRKFR